MIVIDYKEELENVYSANCKTPVVVTLPKMNYIMIDGEGTPNENDENDTHDIYLNDARKTKPENLKTIMRVKIL